MKYRIVKTNYHNRYGDIDDTYYHIENQVKILFFNRWVKIKHFTSEWGDYRKDVTYFKTQESAQEFIDKVLCCNVPRQTHVEEVVSYNECNNK